MDSNSVIDSMNYKIYCDSSCKCDKDIKQTITFGEALLLHNVNDVIELNSCVSIQKNQLNDTACSIKLECKNFKIANISIISEVKMIEIYGEYGEYLTTVKGDLIEEVDGTYVYLNVFSTNALTESTIKFTGLKNIQSFWLFGIRITKLDVKNEDNIDKINYENVYCRLKTLNVPITEKAEQFKKFLQDYNNSGKAHAHQALLRRIVENEYHAKVDMFETLMKNIGSFMPDLQRSPRPDINHENYSNGAMDIQLFNYIDLRFKQVETNLTDLVNKKFAQFETRQNESLGLILTKLDLLLTQK